MNFFKKYFLPILFVIGKTVVGIFFITILSLLIDYKVFRGGWWGGLKGLDGMVAELYGIPVVAFLTFVFSKKFVKKGKITSFFVIFFLSCFLYFSFLNQEIVYKITPSFLLCEVFYKEYCPISQGRCHDKNYCYEKKSRITQNANFCNSIQDNSKKNLCISTFGTYARSKSACETITGDDGKKSKCFISLARISGNEKYCAYITIEKDKESCIIEARVKRNRNMGTYLDDTME